MKTFENYANEDVVFVSLSPEPEADRERIAKWVEDLKIPWSVGYGAEATLAAMEVPGYPTMFVIGRNGSVAWHSFLSGSLESAIRRAL